MRHKVIIYMNKNILSGLGLWTLLCVNLLPD